MPTLGEAAVEIIAETGDFDDDLRRRLQSAVDDATEEMREDLRRVSRQAEDTGRALREEIGDGAAAATRRIDQMERVARQAEQALQEMDPAQLRRVAEQAERSRGAMQEMVREARLGEGAFADMEADQLERIAEQAERAFRDMERLGNQARHAADEVARFGDAGEVEELARQIDQARRATERLNQTRFQRIRGEAGQAGRAIFEAFRGSSERARREVERIDNVRFQNLTRRAVEVSDRVRRSFSRIGDNDQVGQSISRLARTFTTLVGATAAVGALGAALAGLGAVAAGVVAVVAPTAEIIAALPAAALLAGAAFATLRVALSGVGEAFTAALTGDAAEFEKSLENLAPAARDVAREVRALKPAFDELRRSVQGAFFEQLDGEVTAVARNLGGPLRRGMTAAAAEFGRLARSAVRFGRSAEAVDLVDEVFGTLRDTLGSIRSDTITNLLGSFSRFVRATLPGFDGLGGAIDGALGRLATFLGEAASGGDALRWVREGTAAVRALGSLLADLGRVAVGTFRAMQAASGGALGSVARLADSMAAFVNSAQGQAALVGVFQGINAVAAETGQVVQALIVGLGQLAPTIGRIAAQVGPTLTAAIEGLVPAFQGLGDGMVVVFEQLRIAVERVAGSGALGQLGRALGDLAAAAAPLLPAIGDVLVSAFRSLAVAAAAVAPVLELVAGALAAVLSSPLGAALGPLVAQLLLVRVATGAWGTALRSLLPVLKLAGKGAMSLGKALVGAIARHPIGAIIVGIAVALGFILTRFESVRNALSRFRDAVVDAFGRLREFGSSLLNTFRTEGPVAAIRQLGSAIVSGLGAAVSAGLRLIPRLISGILSGLAAGLAAVPGLISQLGEAIRAGLQRIATDGPRIARQLADGMRSAWSALREQAPVILAALREAISGAVAALRTEGPRIQAAVSSLLREAFDALRTYGPQLASGLGQAFTAVNSVLLRLAAEGIRRAGDALARNLPGLATRISDALSRMITRAGEVIPELLGQLTQRISEGLGQAVSEGTSGAGGGGGKGGAGGGLQQSLIDLILDVGVAVIEQIPKLTPVITQAIGQIAIAVATAAAQALPGILAAIGTLVMTAAQGIFTQLGAFLLSLPARVVGWLAGLVPALLGAGVRAMGGLLQGFVSGVGSVIGFLAAFPARAGAALGALAGQLFQRGVQAMTRLRSALSTGASNAVAFMRGLPGRISSTLASLPGLLQSRASSAMARFRSALSSGGSGAVSYVRGLPGRIVGALGGLAGQLAGVGRAAMQGFINGARSMAGSMVSAVTAPIRNAISAARSLLSIGSPSRLFHQFGEWTAEGFIEGLGGHDRDVERAAEGMVAASGVVGDRTRGAFYDAGRAAAQGFVAGLRSQRDELVDVMTDLAERIADTVRRTLRISSPSRVMAGLGEDTVAGYLAGLESAAPRIQRALAAAVTPPRTVVQPVRRPAVAPVRPAAEQPAGFRRGDGWHTAPRERLVKRVEVNAPVNLTIPTPDPEAAAHLVSERIATKVTR